MRLESSHKASCWCACTTPSCTATPTNCDVSNWVLLWGDSRRQRIKIVTLHVWKEDFYWCKLEVIRSKIHQRHLKKGKLRSHIVTSMIRSIVKHNHSIISPLAILWVEMFNKLDDEEHKGVCVVLSSIDSEEEFTNTADASDNIELTWTLSHSGFVLHACN